MNQLFSLLTVASVLTHAVLGCCAHAPEGSSCCDEAMAICAAHAEHDHSHEQAPEDQHECCRVKCQWLAPDAPADLSATLLSYAAIFDVDQTASTFATTISHCEENPCNALPALPVRSHLALGVLLI